MIVQGTKPAQVIVKIVAGNAVKAIEPLFEAAVIGIDVLDVDSALDAQASAEVDGVVRDVGILRKVAVGRIAIADQQRIPGQDGLQEGTELGFAHLSVSRDPVQSLPGTVARHQNAHQLAGQTGGCWPSCRAGGMGGPACGSPCAIAENTSRRLR